MRPEDLPLEDRLRVAAAVSRFFEGLAAQQRQDAAIIGSFGSYTEKPARHRPRGGRAVCRTRMRDCYGFQRIGVAQQGTTFTTLHLLAHKQRGRILTRLAKSDHLGHPFAVGYFMQAKRRPSLAVMRNALAHPRLLGGCQSAFKFDPSSVSNFDPFERRGLAVALVSSELAGIAETRRARVAWSSSRLLNRSCRYRSRRCHSDGSTGRAAQ